ncbi:cyclase family protein [Candidatus Caldatribacterium sp.]|uniref:cyclase family protein n=1 Tax=Candidatus Caldatribacterium sp. TaxID=2282143 RepID=UPI00299456D2|nr:cyclase family protein [Candidatus Caldatribacterium sp.]MDW8081827.1 cyclase family protein [Candidatus Calescibacterium sp.]
MTVRFGDLLPHTRKGEKWVLVDLSRELLPGEATFPGDPPFLVLPWHDLAVHGFASRVLFLFEHLGTHVDVPAHFLAGAEEVAGIPLERFCGRARVIDVFSLARPFTQEDLKKCGVVEGDIVLFVGNPHLQECEAQALVDCKVKGVGVEAESIDEPPFPLHRLFLGAGILIYESLTNVRELLGKEAFFFGFPLKIPSGTASPIRAVAITLSLGGDSEPL